MTDTAETLRNAMVAAQQRLNESGTGEMGLLDTIHAVHAIIVDALEAAPPAVMPGREEIALAVDAVLDEMDDPALERDHHIEFATRVVAALSLSPQPDGWREIASAPKDREVEVRGRWKLRGDGVEFTHWRDFPSPPPAAEKA